MSIKPQHSFDDRLFILIGVPMISLFVVLFFLDVTPHSNGWKFFSFSWTISALYTCTYWFTARWIISYWRKRRPGTEQTSKRIVKTLLSIITVVVLFESLCFFGFSWGNLFFGAHEIGHNILQTGPVSLILVIAVTGIYEAIYFFTLFRKAELDKERLLRSQIENQLNGLRKQVDPHFLFNSLNTLASLIPENPVAAQEFTERLSSTYRRLLQWRNVGRATIEQELEALGDYLHLLEVRFETRLQVDIRIDPGLSEYFIAALALQQLVENAVKHNEASLSNPLIIEIFSEGQSITVTNLKRLKAKIAVDSTRFGLENLRDRVRFLNEKEVIIQDTKERFSVTVPLLSMAPAPLLYSSKKAS